jgi:hypothetical protein
MKPEVIMELVGTAKEYREEHEGLRLIFRCCNKEEFDLKVSPALKRIPPAHIVRVWTQRPEDEMGMPKKENVLVHWEEL